MGKQKTPRRWLRFHLRTLLVLVTLLSVALGWIGWELDQRRSEKEVVRWIYDMGGEVLFFVGNSAPMSDQRSWLEKTKDNWFGERVRFVKLKNLRTFSVGNTQVNDLSALAELTKLEILILDYTQVSDLSSLAELKNLTFIDISNTQVSDLSPLSRLENLKTLYVSSTPLSDLLPLTELKNLERFCLIGSDVSGEQVQELRQALPDCYIERWSKD